MKELVLKYWGELQTREQWVLVGGVLVVFTILFYQLIWGPWHLAINNMQNSLVTHRQNLVWLKQHAELVTNGDVSFVAESKLGKGQSLLSVIEETARSNGVGKSIQKLTPRDDGQQVTVILELASFNSWVRWADVLQSQYGVSITQLSAEREDKPDIAEIRVTFSRS